MGKEGLWCEPPSQPRFPPALACLLGESKRGPGCGRAKESQPQDGQLVLNPRTCLPGKQLSFRAKPRPDSSLQGMHGPLRRRAGKFGSGPALLHRAQGGERSRGERQGGAEGAGRGRAGGRAGRSRGGRAGRGVREQPPPPPPAHSTAALCPHISQRSFLCSPGEECSGREQGRKPKGLQRGGKEQREKDHLARERVPAATSWPEQEKRQVAGRDPGGLCSPWCGWQHRSMSACTGPHPRCRWLPAHGSPLPWLAREGKLAGCAEVFFSSLTPWKLDFQDKGFQGAWQCKTCRCWV